MIGLERSGVADDCKRQVAQKEDRRRTHNGVSFCQAGRVRLPGPQFADYTLIDPLEADAEGNTRGFSLVQAPFEPDLVAATWMRDTAFKRGLKDLPIGTEVKLDAQYGHFTLHKANATPAVFIIGGFGVTPVRSMGAQAMPDKTGQKITLPEHCHLLSVGPRGHGQDQAQAAGGSPGNEDNIRTEEFAGC